MNMNQSLLGHFVNTAHAANAARQFDVAIWWARKALEMAPHSPEAWFNLGVALAGKADRQPALDAFMRASMGARESAQAQNSIGFQLMELGFEEQAEDCLRRSIELAPADPPPYVNLGKLRAQQRHLTEAAGLFEQAIALQPDFAVAYINLGGVLNDLKRLDEAQAVCRKAVQLAPDSHDAWNNLGLALLEAKDPESIACFSRSLELKPDAEYLAGYLLYAKLRFCDWRDLSGMLRDLEQQIAQGKKVTVPFPLLALTARPDLQRRATELYVGADYPESNSLGPIAQRERGDGRIRIAYFSADFRDHPVSQIMVEVFEIHDRSRFEVIGFSLCPDSPGELRRRIASAFDRFIDVSDQSDADVAALSRQLGIDIAVDLGGHTADSRMGIFSRRAAPVQVGYVGYLGTSGAPYFEYLLADETIIPAGSRAFYTEKIAYLPSYQPTDSAAAVVTQPPSREELGLPPTGFVFACFNNNFKITPPIFDVWARLLQRVDGSVLLLLADNPGVVDNLRREARLRGVEPDRLVFSGRMPRERHMARYQVADLFLDTLPCNAGTTAMEALSVNLPVLTCLGETFAGRIAASQLHAVGLPELVAGDLRAYEALALELATQPERLAALRAKLQRNRLDSRLFDLRGLVRKLEELYLQMHHRWAGGLPPEHLILS